MAERRAATLGDLLASRRRELFVGRESELGVLDAALADEGPAVVHIHGPGGIGKTSLLEAFADRAAEAGAALVRVDGAACGPSPDALREAVGAHLDAPGFTDGRLVLLVDGYERLAGIDGWVRDELLPRLPATAVVVLAGRAAPGAEWRADPAWRGVLREIPLGALSAAESHEFLERCGVDAGLRDRIVAAAHGHPLGLSLLADVVVRGGEPAVDPLAPDVVEALLRRFVDVTCDVRQRRALAVCALARVTTEPLLRVGLDSERSDDVFAWLRGLSFVEEAPDGLAVHELARDALHADLRRRDPEEARQVFHRVAARLQADVVATRGRAQQRAILDLKFLFRYLPGLATPVDWARWGQHFPQPAAPADHEAIVALARAWCGEGSAAIARWWLACQPEGFSVLRAEDGGVRGVIAVLDLTSAAAEDRAADPAASAAWTHAQRTAPPRAGETVTQTRFVIDRDAGHEPSPTLNAVPIVTTQRYLTTPHLAWDFLTLPDPGRWDDFFALADQPRAPEADVEVDGRRHGLYCHDFRQVPIEALVGLWTERAFAQEAAAASAPPAVRTLDHDAFAEAVRQGLRDLHDPAVLGRNPLLGTRLLRRRAAGRAAMAEASGPAEPMPGPAEPTAGDLEGLLREAIDELRRHPADAKALRALEATYLRPSATQEAAAGHLGLPFSTYRRHLARGVGRVTAWLWEREAGPSNGEQG